SSGWVTWKKPCSDTSITRFHCRSDIPAIGASSWMPALLTTIWMGPAASSASTAARAASPSATSNAMASALPPVAMMSSTTVCARAWLLFACTMTCMPAAASRTQIAPPRSPLPPVTSARFIACPVVWMVEYAGLVCGAASGGGCLGVVAAEAAPTKGGGPVPFCRSGFSRDRETMAGTSTRRASPIVRRAQPVSPAGRQPPDSASATLILRIQHHRRTSFRKQLSLVHDAEGVQLAGLAGRELLRLALQRAGKRVDTIHVQDDVAQRHQHSRPGHGARRPCQQATVHRHGLGAVFAQVQRAQLVAA